MNQDLLKNTEIPLGLGMALAENLNALNEFSALSDEQKQSVIFKTHQIQSKQEMHSFVNNHFQLQ